VVFYTYCKERNEIVLFYVTYIPQRSHPVHDLVQNQQATFPLLGSSQGPLISIEKNNGPKILIDRFEVRGRLRDAGFAPSFVCTSRIRHLCLVQCRLAAKIVSMLNDGWHITGLFRWKSVSYPAHLSMNR
jgi:hypothetical protein